MFLFLHWREPTHSERIWHDYPWPWVSLTWSLYNLQLWHHGRWSRKFNICFRPIRKALESLMYYICSYAHNLSSCEIKAWENLAWPGFEPMIPPIPVKRSTNKAIKTTGSWPRCEFVIKAKEVKNTFEYMKEWYEDTIDQRTYTRQHKVIALK